jgi:phage tail sheath protein FI
MATAYLTPGVYVEEVDRGPKPIEGVGTAVAAFLGVAEKGPIGEATMVANWTQYTEQFGGFVPGAYLAQAVYGYFNNGGNLCFVVRVGDESAGEVAAPPATASIGSKANGAPVTLKALARETGAAADGISLEVADGPDDTFNLTVKRGSDEEKFEGLTMARGAKNVLEVVNKQSKLVTLEEVAAKGLAIPERVPAAGTYALTVTGSVALAPVSPEQYEGNTSDRTGLGGLEAIDQVTMVCAPDVMAAYEQGALDKDGVKAVQLAMIAHCERMGDRVAIIDPLPGMNAQEAYDWRQNGAGYDSKYAAMYYPWIQIANPFPGGPSTSLVPPSGHVAGIWARSDGERGVHKAPANEIVRGVLGLPITLTPSEQGVLNPVGVNCIRTFPGRGVRVWGARTLSSDPSWRYLNVRRLFNYVEKSIYIGTQWAVFEPNDQILWAKIRRDVGSFLQRAWMDGALFGATPEQAFFVKCDEENNPSITRDAGQLFVDIGIAPVKPAEFIVFRIGQYSPEG